MSKKQKLTEELQTRMLAFLDETVEYYSADPTTRRCVDGVICNYNPATSGVEGSSEGCAIGRKMTPHDSKLADAVGGDIINVYKKRPELIPDSLKDFPIMFLKDVQLLHDRYAHWNASGISEEGTRCVELIKLEILDGKRYTECIKSTRQIVTSRIIPVRR